MQPSAFCSDDRKCPKSPELLPTVFHTWCLRNIASHSQRVSLIVIPFCLSVCLSLGHSATYSLPRLIDHNQIWSAGIYLSSDPCKPFGSRISHTLGARGKNMQNFAYFQHVDSGSRQTLLVLHRHTHRLTSAFFICAQCPNVSPVNMTHRAIWLVAICTDAVTFGSCWLVT